LHHRHGACNPAIAGRRRQEDDVKDFVKTLAGRMLVCGLGLALAGGGVAILVGQPMATWLLAGVFPVAVALTVIAVATAAVNNWGYAVAGVMVLPFLALLYVPALGLAIDRASPVSWPLIVVGAGAIALGLRPRMTAQRRLEPARAAQH
jgi:hypothetical protein